MTTEQRIRTGQMLNVAREILADQSNYGSAAVFLAAGVIVTLGDDAAEADKALLLMGKIQETWT